MTYKLPEPVQIDKHIPTGIVIRGYTAKHVLDAYTAGVTQTKAKLKSEIEHLKTYNNELEQTNFVLLDHNKKDQEKQVQQQLDLLSANNDLYQHREILLVHLAEIERLRTENLALTQDNKNLVETNLITQKEFSELLNDYLALREDYIQLDFELNVVNSRE